MKQMTLFIPLFVFFSSLFAQDLSDTEKFLRNIADNIINNNPRQFIDKDTGKIYDSVDQLEPDLNLDLASPYVNWRYWNGVLNLAMLELGDIFKEQKYIDYSIENFKFIFANAHYFKNKSGKVPIWKFPFGHFFVFEELDNCGAMGASLIEVYKRDKQKEYRDYIDRAAEYILHGQDRLKDGTLARTYPEEMTLWTDDLYMSLPFMARMAFLTGDSEYFDDGANQVIQFTDYLFDKQTRLYHHCWYSDENVNGVAHWGRANGWAMMAQVDFLKLLPEDHVKRDTLIAILKQQIFGVARYQSESGLWHQILDRDDSYPESSCTAMFTYGIAAAVNQGWIPERYISVAEMGWKGLQSKTTHDGQVKDICVGTAVRDNMNFYYTRPAKLNDIHGLGAILAAGIEILKYELNNHK